MARARAAAAAAAALALCAVAVPAAQGEQASVGVHPSFLPDRLGATTSFTIAFHFAGGEEGVPPPLRQVAVRLPAGLRIELNGVKVCPLARLRRSGPSGCPGALIGRGHASLIVHAGSQAVPEQASISILRGPTREALPTFELWGHGSTPLDQTAISTEILETDKAPFGWRTLTTVPPIPTLMYEPDASFVSVSVTVGGIRRSPKAHTAGGSIVMPHSCPSGGFPFVAEATFADNETANATATVPCP